MSCHAVDLAAGLVMVLPDRTFGSRMEAWNGQPHAREGPLLFAECDSAGNDAQARLESAGHTVTGMTGNRLAPIIIRPRY